MDFNLIQIFDFHVSFFWSLHISYWLIGCHLSRFSSIRVFLPGGSVPPLLSPLLFWTIFHISSAILMDSVCFSQHVIKCWGIRSSPRSAPVSNSCQLVMIRSKCSIIFTRVSIEERNFEIFHFCYDHDWLLDKPWYHDIHLVWWKVKIVVKWKIQSLVIKPWAYISIIVSINLYRPVIGLLSLRLWMIKLTTCSGLTCNSTCHTGNCVCVTSHPYRQL